MHTALPGSGAAHEAHFPPGGLRLEHRRKGTTWGRPIGECRGGHGSEPALPASRVKTLQGPQPWCWRWTWPCRAAELRTLGPLGRLCPMEGAELGLAKVRARVQNVSGLLRSPVNYDDDAVSHEQRAGRGWTVVRVLGGPLGCPGDRTRAVARVSARLQRGFYRFAVGGEAGSVLSQGPRAGSLAGCQGGTVGVAPLPFKAGNLESPDPPAPPRGWPPGLLVRVGWCSRSCFLSGIRCSGARMSHAESSSWAPCAVPRGGRRGGFRGNQRLSQLIPVELARPAPHAPHTRCLFLLG